jgi:hypothetical protein
MSLGNERSPLSPTFLAVLGALLMLVAIAGMVIVIIHLGH